MLVIFFVVYVVFVVFTVTACCFFFFLFFNFLLFPYLIRKPVTPAVFVNVSLIFLPFAFFAVLIFTVPTGGFCGDLIAFFNAVAALFTVACEGLYCDATVAA